MHKLWLILTLSAVLVLEKPAWCWDEIGHQVIAQIAWNSLQPNPDVQRRVLGVLAGHPQPKYRSFIFASVYPDDLKKTDIPKPEQHREWHFVDIPYRSDTEPNNQLGALPAQANVVVKIKEIANALKNRTGSPIEQAGMLCWLIHLVGDVHQPLHCTTRVTPQRPEGDRGGNDFKIKPIQIGDWTIDNLHSYWDAALELKGGGSVEKRAQSIMKKHKVTKLQAALRDSSPESWAYASAGLAIRDVYNYGNITEGARPSKKYRKHTYAVARQRIALAGYRLAIMLRQIYG